MKKKRSFPVTLNRCFRTEVRIGHAAIFVLRNMLLMTTIAGINKNNTFCCYFAFKSTFQYDVISIFFHTLRNKVRYSF